MERRISKFGFYVRVVVTLVCAFERRVGIRSLLRHKRSTSTLISVMPVEASIRTVVRTFALQEEWTLFGAELSNVTILEKVTKCVKHLKASISTLNCCKR